MKYCVAEIKVASDDANKLLKVLGLEAILEVDFKYQRVSISYKISSITKSTMLLNYCSRDEAYMWLLGFNTAVMIPSDEETVLRDKKVEDHNLSSFVPSFIKRWFLN